MDTATFSVSINGELEDFFPSLRGIRQGCSLFPYLYAIVSNVLSKLINKAVVNGSIGYHPMCSPINLTQLSFADDIVVFANESFDSLSCTLTIFQEFLSLFGLHISAAKSTVFAAERGNHALEMVVGSVGLTVSPRL